MVAPEDTIKLSDPLFCKTSPSVVNPKMLPLMVKLFNAAGLHLKTVVPKITAKETKRIITIEDHNIIGGLGTAVCEVLSGNFPAKVTRIGINDTFGESGKAEELLKKYNLNSEYLVKILSK